MKKAINQTHLGDYENTAQIPMLWQCRARECICAANILRAKFEDTDLFGPGAPAASRLSKPYSVVRLLYGLALENLLKGLLVAQGVSATSAGKLSQGIHSHDLETLWTKAGFDLTDQAKRVLNGLRWSVESGKYPIGTRVAKHNPNERQRNLGATTNLKGVIRLIEAVEDALRQAEPLRAIEKTDLLGLCYK